MKESFMFYKNIWDSVMLAPTAEEQIRHIKIICNYVYHDIEPTDWRDKQFLQNLKPTLDKDPKHGGKREGAGAPTGNKNRENPAKKQSKSIKFNQVQSSDKINQDNQDEKFNQPLKNENENKKIDSSLRSESIPPLPVSENPNGFSSLVPPGGGSESAEPPPAPKKKFIPPTVDEVAAYCAERKNAIDPQAFVDHYTARGWRYNGNLAMKDWRAAVRIWERRDRSIGPPANAQEDEEPWDPFADLPPETDE
jgi:hypothetical protein